MRAKSGRLSRARRFHGPHFRLTPLKRISHRAWLPLLEPIWRHCVGAARGPHVRVEICNPRIVRLRNPYTAVSSSWQSRMAAALPLAEWDNDVRRVSPCNR